MAVARSAEAYAAQLADHLPPGDMWQRGADPTMGTLLLWSGQTFAYVDRRRMDVLREADPRQAVELLPDWEAEVGLPDPCTPLTVMSVGQRRSLVVARLTARGGQSRAFFIALAEALGYPGATVTEFRPFTTRSACNAPVHGPRWWWTWRLNLPGAFNIRRFTARSAVNEPLRSWGDSALECTVRRVKPAHSHVLFRYG
ncbi:YmfQ family protein [Humitalea sp. 24SJ18S-53]|uniref:YmfQ family protein n=1 Tax=Humitalea sp. 24SJ18S-53 TaxID=3422307 RepID=UPI003D669577